MLPSTSADVRSPDDVIAIEGPHPEDPPDITAARAQEEKIIRGWIDAAAAK